MCRKPELVKGHAENVEKFISVDFSYKNAEWCCKQALFHMISPAY
jgi:hypothetical protein